MHEQNPIKKIWSKHLESSKTLKILSSKFFENFDDYACMNVKQSKRKGERVLLYVKEENPRRFWLKKDKKIICVLRRDREESKRKRE